MKCSSKTFIVLCELCIAFQFIYVIRNFCILNCLDIGFYVRYSVTQFAGFLKLRSLNNEFVIQFSISGRKFHLQFHMCMSTCIVWYDRKMVTLFSLLRVEFSFLLQFLLLPFKDTAILRNDELNIIKSTKIRSSSDFFSFPKQKHSFVMNKHAVNILENAYLQKITVDILKSEQIHCPI